MTTNQTIDGVPRKPEWCEALLKLEVVREALTSSDSAERLKNMDAGKVLREGIALLKELRALLDAPTKPIVEISLALLNTACNGFVQEQGHALNELREILSSHKVDKNVKSTGVILDSTDSGNSSNGDSNLSIKVVAVQPQGEHVAVVLPERPYASEEDQQTMTDYEVGLGHGACEMWDKIKRLNGL